jgi:thiol-disulfide isomerase/thioredoxin
LALAEEQKKIEQAQRQYIAEVDTLRGDVGYFVRLQESLMVMNTLLSSTTPPPAEKLQAAQQQFEKAVNFTDERLWHSGILHRLVYSYYSLSSVLEGGYQHASDFLASRLANSPVKNTYLEEIIGVVQGQPAIAEYFSQKMLAVSEQCDDMPGNDMPGRIKRQLEQYSLLKVGSPAPDELLQNGKRISELPGAYKLIVFWASWCEHCQKEIPELRAMYADLKKQDVEVVGMGMDDNAQIHQLVSQVNPWVSHFVGRDWNAPVSQHYRVFGTPTYFLVDKEMKIVARPKSSAEVAQWLNRNKM